MKYHLTYAEERNLDAEVGPHAPPDVLTRARFYLERRQTTDPVEAVRWAWAWYRNSTEQSRRRFGHATGARPTERPPQGKVPPRPGEGTRAPRYLP